MGIDWRFERDKYCLWFDPDYTEVQWRITVHRNVTK